MEDIIVVLDGRAEIVNEVNNVDLNLRDELSDRFSKPLKDNRFIDFVLGHMPTDITSQARVTIIIDVINKIVG